ncbi:hypothetical protein [Serratia sarumanii]|uniref:hypothetical protein n=1 Tax=Serratia sarumanii TaxID=3020826 RepID=UPI003F80117E
MSVINMCITDEVYAMERMRLLNGYDGQISSYIYGFKAGQIIFDRYSWGYQGDLSNWDNDQSYDQRMILKYSNKETFKRAYRLARLLRGKVN